MARLTLNVVYDRYKDFDYMAGDYDLSTSRQESFEKGQIEHVGAAFASDGTEYGAFYYTNYGSAIPHTVWTTEHSEAILASL